eukprot:g22278.t1
MWFHIQQVRSQFCSPDTTSHEWRSPASQIPVFSQFDSLVNIKKISRCDIKKRLKALATAKAKEIDKFLAIALKTCAPELATPLAKLFLYIAIFLRRWKIAQ